VINRIAAVLPFVVFLAIYGAAIGHGFISDDFGWILDSRVHGARDLAALFARSSGFYRPIVGLTFAADYALFDAHPLGYGLTNLALALACAASLFAVTREFGVPPAGALLASALWLLNPHGLNTAIIWISGRTSLLLTMFALVSALAVLRGRPFLALAPMAAALLSKEEAVMLPVILLAWWFAIGRGRRPDGKRLTVWIVCAGAIVAIYVALRAGSGAMTPSTAPAYYRFTLDPAVVLRNVAEYADRAMTFPAAVALLAWIVLRPSPRTGLASREVLICGGVWIAGAYALTVLLPVRSSLYACFPCAGSCLVAAEVASRCWTASTQAGRRRAAVAAVVLSLGMSPVLVLRNRNTVANARFSTAALHAIELAAAGAPAEATVVVLDDRARKPNVETAFNTQLPGAFELITGQRRTFWVEPELKYARALGFAPPCPACPAVSVDLRGLGQGIKP